MLTSAVQWDPGTGCGWREGDVCWELLRNDFRSWNQMCMAGIIFYFLSKSFWVCMDCWTWDSNCTDLQTWGVSLANTGDMANGKMKRAWGPGDSTGLQVSSVQFSHSVVCDPMNCSTPGLPVHHQLPEFTQTHVHWVGDAIQPSHPLSSPSPTAPNPSQHQSLFQWVNSSHEVAKVLEFQL